jgi:hypothetical protein
MKGSKAGAASVHHFLQSFQLRYPAPAKVFCSRELENGLAEYVKRELSMNSIYPSNDQMRQRAREIVGMQKTPADDPVLLEKFKTVIQGVEAPQLPLTTRKALTTGSPNSEVSALTTYLTSVPATSDQPNLFSPGNSALTDQEVSNILEGMNNEFSEVGILNMDLSQQEIDGAFIL